MNDVRRTPPSWGRPSILFIFLAGLIGLVVWGPCASQPSESSPRSEVSSGTWTCAMHSGVRLPRPGVCPTCEMDLVVVVDLDPTATNRLSLSPEAVALAEVETAVVVRRSVFREVRLAGKIAVDETRVHQITVRVAGWLNHLYVDSRGVTVQPGDHLLEIYSPELLSAQQGLLQAIESVERLHAQGVAVPKRMEDALDAARARLRQWGLLDQQIEAIEEQGVLSEQLVLYAPEGGVVTEKHAVEGAHVNVGDPLYTIADLSQIWVMLDAYEMDLPWIRIGQQVNVRVEALPGELFEAHVSFIDPITNDATRTTEVRVHLENRDGHLKPGMFVTGTILAQLTSEAGGAQLSLSDLWTCSMDPEVLETEEGDCSICGMKRLPPSGSGSQSVATGQFPLVVPATAPLVTGARALVYVRLPGATNPTFEARNVVLGPRAGDDWVVLEGLVEGEVVVVAGAFKLDAELQIQGGSSLMSDLKGR